MDRLYKVNLSQPQFEISPFQAVAFEPKSKPDVSLLTKGMELAEERLDKYNESSSAMEAAFDKLQSELHQDEKTLQFFEDFKNKYKYKMEDFAATGDYANAARVGAKTAVQMLQDGELVGHINYNTTYNKKHEAVVTKATGNDDVLGLNLYEYRNKYDPEDIQWTKNDYGEITGAEDYQEKDKYIGTIDYTKDIYAKGVQLVNVDQLGSSVSRNYSNSYGDSDGSSSRSSNWSKGYNISKMTIDQIKNSWRNVAYAYGINPEKVKYDYDARVLWRDQLQEQYDKKAAEDEYFANSQEGKDLKYQIKLYNDVLQKNDSDIGYQEFFARMVFGGFTGDNAVADSVAELLSYTHRSTENSKGGSTSRTVNDSDKSGGGHSGHSGRSGRSGGRNGGRNGNGNSNLPGSYTPARPLGRNSRMGNGTLQERQGKSHSHYGTYYKAGKHFE